MNTSIDTKFITGNHPLVLTDPQTLWIVRSGSVAIFATELCHGEIVGDRRYLFTVEVGEALFGMAPAQDARLGLMAVALEPSELTPYAIDQANCATLPDAFHALLEQWINQISRVIGSRHPQASLLSNSMQYLSFMADQIIQPPEQQVIWIQIQQGQAYWLGDSNWELDATTGLIPLGSSIWLKVANSLELLVQQTIDLAAPSLLAGLAQLQAYSLRSLERQIAQEQATAQQRLQQRHQLNQQVAQTTIRSLASVLKPRSSQRMTVEEPLLVAAGAVGKVLGVAIEPPMKSEDRRRLKEPLEAIARASKLRLRQVLLRDHWWARDGGPILAYTRQGHHPVALLPTGRTGYVVFDPLGGEGQSAPAAGDPTDAIGTRQVVTDQVAASLEPMAYVFYRPLPDGVLQAIDLLKFTFRGRQRDILTVLLAGVAATLLGMLVPQATAVLIDTAIPFNNTGLLGQLGLGLLAVAVGGALFQLVQTLATMRIETLSDTSLQIAVWDRLLKLRSSFFREYSVGDLNSRVSSISAIRRKLSGTALQSLFVGFFSLLNLGLLFYYSRSLALLAVVVSLLVMIVTIASGTLLIRKHRPLMALEGEINGIMVQLINGVPKLRLAGAEVRAFAYWGGKYTDQLRLLLSTQRLEDAAAVFNTVLPTLTTVALFWLVSLLLHAPNTQLSTGTFLAFSVAYGTFISGITSLSNTVIDVLEVVPLWQRSQPILTAEPEVDLNKVDPGRLEGEVLMDHLSFRYREDGPLILDDVTIEAKPGEFVALVGPSGSGKSTVIRLLLGFEMPLSGTVYFDGQDLAGLDVSAVRRQLGVVLQNGRINAGSIFENIASGALITMDEAWTAAEMAGFADDVRAMPMQLHTIVSEGGTNLSGGQRQRLIIARALALKPRILLLDEATSALDNRTQAIVSESLDRLNVTRLVIAHRLSTIRHADQIYVLEAGRVVQQGTFESLAAQPGLFSQLIKRQMA